MRGNLFYRGLVLERPVFLGRDAAHPHRGGGPEAEPAPAGRVAAGLVALRIRTTDAHGEPLLDFWRCPMIPLRDPEAETGHADGFDDIPRLVDPAAVERAVPDELGPRALREATPGPHHEDARRPASRSSPWRPARR